MAHFAKINSSNTVIEVIKVMNGVLLDDEGNEVEQKGIDFCKSLYGQNTRWVQCSWNTDKGVHYTQATDETVNLSLSGITPHPCLKFVHLYQFGLY